MGYLGRLLHGAPGGIRTPGLRIRSPTLYPAELQAQAKQYSKPKAMIVQIYKTKNKT
jgi:hypothetical protein